MRVALLELLPRWVRRTRSLDALLPVLYLREISIGDFQEALAALLSRDALNLSPAVVTKGALSPTTGQDLAAADGREPVATAPPD